MTPPDWASQRVEKVSSDGFSGDAWAVSADECARLLRLEHARAVRIVKRHANTVFGLAYNQAVTDILLALQRGRTQKGTR